MNHMEHFNLLSPLLIKVEVLLVLVTILAASVAWLFWEIVSFIGREKEEEIDFEALKKCNHHRLIIPVSVQSACERVCDGCVALFITLPWSFSITSFLASIRCARYDFFFSPKLHLVIFIFTARMRSGCSRTRHSIQVNYGTSFMLGICF